MTPTVIPNLVAAMAKTALLGFVLSCCYDTHPCPCTPHRPWPFLWFLWSCSLNVLRCFLICSRPVLTSAACVFLSCCLPCYLFGYLFDIVHVPSYATMLIIPTKGLTILAPNLAFNFGLVLTCLFMSTVSFPKLSTGALCASTEPFPSLDLLPGAHHPVPCLAV